MSKRQPKQIVKELLTKTEAFDLEGILHYFTDTPVYQFGNFPPALNKGAIREYANSLFQAVATMSHEVKAIWEEGDVVFVEMDVHYTRKDGSSLSLPCCNIFRFQDNLIAELRVFMDANPIFDPTAFVSETASVMVKNY